MQVTIVLYTLSVTVFGASIHLEESEKPHNFIYGIEEYKLPEEYKDIAMMCDLFKRLNALTNFKSMPPNTLKDETYITSEDSDLNGNNELDVDNFKEMQVEMETDNDLNTDISSIGLADLKNKQTVRKERVRRDDSDAFPKELLESLHGVCVTDECLRILREFYEWRQMNGYPVYTGISQLG